MSAKVLEVLRHCPLPAPQPGPFHLSIHRLYMHAYTDTDSQAICSTKFICNGQQCTRANQENKRSSDASQLSSFARLCLYFAAAHLRETRVARIASFPGKYKHCMVTGGC